MYLRLRSNLLQPPPSPWLVLSRVACVSCFRVIYLVMPDLTTTITGLAYSISGGLSFRLRMHPVEAGCMPFLVAASALQLSTWSVVMEIAFVAPQEGSNISTDRCLSSGNSSRNGSIMDCHCLLLLLRALEMTALFSCSRISSFFCCWHCYRCCSLWLVQRR